MKKSFFYAGILAAGLMTVSTSCSKDEKIIDGGIETPIAGAQELVLMASSGGDGLTTKAGRPMYSSEAKQNIDKVLIKFVNGRGNVYETVEITDWMTVSEDYSVNGHGKQYTYKLPKEKKLADDTYRIYAVGYSEGTDYLDDNDWFRTNTGDPFTFFKSTIKDDVLGEEIFAGEIAAIEVKDGEFVLKDNLKANVLTLHRQVAGNMGYFTDIPTYQRGKSSLLDHVTEGQVKYNEANKAVYKNIVNSYKLRLVASNISDKILFESFNHSFTTTGNDVFYVVNGVNNSIEKDAKFAVENATSNEITTPDNNDGYLVYEIALKDWFPNGDVNLDGILGEGDATGDNWLTPSQIQGAGFKPGSVFAGQFMIPFTKVSNKATLQLQLVGNTWSSTDGASGGGHTLAEGAEDVLRVWSINLPANDPQIQKGAGEGRHVDVLDETTGVPTKFNGEEEKANSYSIVRNHMYAVGEKGSDKYDPETDKPEPLDKGQTLELKVNDNWELIHQMEVE